MTNRPTRMTIAEPRPLPGEHLLMFVSVLSFAPVAIGLFLSGLSSFPVAGVTLVGMFGVLSLTCVVVRFRRRERYEAMLRDKHFRVCPQCRYELGDGPESGNCPECGTFFNDSELRRIWTHWSRTDAA